MKHMLMAVLLMTTMASCKKKHRSQEELTDMWQGTGGTPLECGNFNEDRVATCIGRGQVWTCVSQRGWDTRYHCAPKVQPLAEQR